MTITVTRKDQVDLSGWTLDATWSGATALSPVPSMECLNSNCVALLVKTGDGPVHAKISLGDGEHRLEDLHVGDMLVIKSEFYGVPAVTIDARDVTLSRLFRVVSQ